MNVKYMNVPTKIVEMITPTVEKIITGIRCLRKSCRLMWIAPAKSRKFSIEPIKTSVKSTLAIISVNPLNISGYDFPTITRVIDTIMASSMIPIADGNFKYRRFRYEKIAVRTMRTESE